jgi:hypothetical protein
LVENKKQELPTGFWNDQALFETDFRCWDQVRLPWWLNHNVENHCLVVFYPPMFDALTGRLPSCEDLGAVCPDTAKPGSSKWEGLMFAWCNPGFYSDIMWIHNA